MEEHAVPLLMLVARARCHGSPHQRERENRHPWRHGNRPRGRAPPWRAFRRAPAGGRTRTLVGGRRCGARRLRPLQGDTSFKVTPPSWRGGAAVAGRQSSGFLPSFSRPTKRLWQFGHTKLWQNSVTSWAEQASPKERALGCPPRATRAPRRAHRLVGLGQPGPTNRLWPHRAMAKLGFGTELLAWHPKLPLACSSVCPFVLSTRYLPAPGACAGRDARREARVCVAGPPLSAAAPLRGQQGARSPRVARAPRAARARHPNGARERPRAGKRRGRDT